MIEDLLTLIWAFLGDNTEEAGTLSVLTVAVIWFRKKVFSLFGIKLKEEEPQNIIIEISQPTPNVPLTTLTLDQYEERLAIKLKAKEDELKTAHDAEKTQLQQQIDELRKRAANPEVALSEAKETITKLEAALEREGNELGEARMAEAREALEAGDFSIADNIFTEIEAREQLAVKRVARAAYARGKIAAQDVRWADAMNHFARAAALEPTFGHLKSARIFAWHAGQFDEAIRLGEHLLKVAKKKFGSNNKNYSSALNGHAQSLHAQGKYAEAEPLLRQAINIDKIALGENHPDYASNLNNLAEVYKAQGKYDQAEPLYKQAIEIDKIALGEKHPEYATDLNNLAELYRAQGKYDQAEPLYLQVISIGKETLGEKHPYYATWLNNLSGHYQDQGKYDQAEPLLKQAISIGKITLGEQHPDYASWLNNQALLYKDQKKYDQAEPFYKQAIETFKAALGLDHPSTKAAIENYAIFKDERD